MGLRISYRTSGPNVINEIIDGEAVIINLETGSYYSLDKVGAHVWSYIEKNATTKEIIGSIMRRYDGDATEIERGVTRLIEELQREDLVVPAEPTRNDGDSVLSMKTDWDLKGVKPRFEPPVLHKYTDMQELLLLDPIHEVDEVGWPSRKPDHSS